MHAWGYASDKRLRDENQDHYGIFEVPLGLLAIVCDGMGGHVGGAVASALAVREVHAYLLEAQGDPQTELQSAIERANMAVYDRSRKSRRLMGMGTTAVAALLTENGLFIAHVGDSRAYFCRDGEAESVTRDHTMVNLFVDAELLSPDDAASHPEAHVLARSLGVERNVEVDVQEALPFEPGDTVLLCSDGVHGFVNEPELAAQNWRRPQEGIEVLFKLLRERNSDDNATMLVLTAEGDDAVVAMPFTDLPEIPNDEVVEGNRLSSVPTRAPSSPTIAPLDYDEPTQIPPPLSAPSPQIQYEEIGAPPPMNLEIGVEDDGPPLSPSSAEFVVGEEAKAPTGERDLSKAKPVKSNRLRNFALIGLLLAGVGVGSLALLVVVTQNGGDTPQAGVSVEGVQDPVPQPEPAPDTAPPEPAPEGQPVVAEVEPTDGVPEVAPIDPVPEVVPIAVPEVPPEPIAEVQPEPAPIQGIPDVEPAELGTDGVALLSPLVEWAPTYDDEDPGFVVEVVPPPSDDGGFYIHAEKPDMGRTGMHRAENYVNVPPGGATQIGIVKTARAGECGESMAKLKTAMDISIDYASIYTQVWSCYNLSHQRKLYGVAITDFESYEEQLVHFEGERSTRGFGSSPWGAPAPNGIDHRIESWVSAEGEASFPLVILDLVGAEQAAMDLAGDLLLEAEAAAAFGRLARPTTKEIGYWARRVYITSLGLTGSSGDMIAEHQPDTHKRIEELLNEATRGGLDNPTGVRLPAAVKQALLAGLGKREVRVYVAPVKPKPITTPQVAPAPEPEDVRPVIYQGPPHKPQ